MTLLERVPVAQIGTEARDIHFGRLLLTVLAGLLFAVGWLLGRVWLAFAWTLAAVKVGWREGRTASDGGG